MPYKAMEYVQSLFDEVEIQSDDVRSLYLKVLNVGSEGRRNKLKEEAAIADEANTKDGESEVCRQVA